MCGSLLSVAVLVSSSLQYAGDGIWWLDGAAAVAISAGLFVVGMRTMVRTFPCERRLGAHSSLQYEPTDNAWADSTREVPHLHLQVRLRNIQACTFSWFDCSCYLSRKRCAAPHSDCIALLSPTSPQVHNALQGNRFWDPRFWTMDSKRYRESLPQGGSSHKAIAVLEVQNPTALTAGGL